MTSTKRHLALSGVFVRLSTVFKYDQSHEPPASVIAAAQAIFTTDRNKSTMLRVIPLLKGDKAELQIQHDSDHSIVITQILIWREGRDRWGPGTRNVLDGHPMNLPPKCEKRLGITEPLLTTVGADHAVVGVWIVFNVDPKPAGYPAPARYEVQVRDSRIVRFVSMAAGASNADNPHIKGRRLLECARHEVQLDGWESAHLWDCEECHKLLLIFARQKIHDPDEDQDRDKH
jgi:hypothetical protein